MAWITRTRRWRGSPVIGVCNFPTRVFAYSYELIHEAVGSDPSWPCYRGVLGAVVLLDPDYILTEVDLEELGDEVDLIHVANWIDLRRAWDLDIRRRNPGRPSAGLVVSDDFRSSERSPWDIEHEAVSVRRVRYPVPAELRLLFRSSGDYAGIGSRVAALTHSSSGDIVKEAFGVRTGNVADELDAISRLRLDPSTPGGLWDHLVGVFSTELARDVVARMETSKASSMPGMTGLPEASRRRSLKCLSRRPAR